MQRENGYFLCVAMIVSLALFAQTGTRKSTGTQKQPMYAPCNHGLGAGIRKDTVCGLAVEDQIGYKVPAQN